MEVGLSFVMGRLSEFIVLCCLTVEEKEEAVMVVGFEAVTSTKLTGNGGYVIIRVQCDSICGRVGKVYVDDKKWLVRV